MTMMSEPLDLAAIRERSDRYMSLADRFDEDGNLPGLKSQATGYAIGLSATLTAADVPALLAEVERLRTALAKARRYTNGRCRSCGKPEGRHLMYCDLYVGPLTHQWTRLSPNGTFGGTDYRCSCGGWFRQGGMAGHGDGTEGAAPLCPNAEESYRGPAADVDGGVP